MSSESPIKNSKIAAKPSAPVYTRKRILLTGCNSLVGHNLFQLLRNDDLMIKSGGKAHEFLGTLV
jgi:hypothetical protein